MVTAELLSILCCPETHQDLRVADATLISALNSQIQSRAIRNRGGKLVEETIDGGLVRTDKKFIYPIRKNIPVLLIDEALPLDS